MAGKRAKEAQELAQLDADLDLMLGGKAFEAVGVRQVNPEEGAKALYDELQMLECVLCGTEYIASQADAEALENDREMMCPCAEVTEMAAGPYVPHSIEERALVGLLQAFGELAFKDVAAFFSPTGKMNGGSFVLTKDTVTKLEAVGLVTVDSHPPATMDTLMVPKGGPTILTTIQRADGLYEQVQTVVVEKVEVPTANELHVALAA